MKNYIQPARRSRCRRRPVAARAGSVVVGSFAGVGGL